MVPARAHVTGHAASIVNVNGGMHFPNLETESFPTLHCLMTVKPIGNKMRVRLRVYFTVDEPGSGRDKYGPYGNACNM